MPLTRPDLDEFYLYLKTTGKLYDHPLADLMKLYDEWKKPPETDDTEFKWRVPKMMKRIDPQ